MVIVKQHPPMTNVQLSYDPSKGRWRGKGAGVGELIAVVLVALVFGCSGRKIVGLRKAFVKRHAPAATAQAGARANAPERVSPRKHSFNVLLLTVDAMRADVPWQGYPRDILPNLTRLAKESVVYTNAYSVSSSTPKSLAALFTGRYPSSLYRSGWFFAGYTQPELFLAHRLRDGGIATMGWQVHPYLQHAKGLSQGYTVWQLVRPQHVLDASNPESTGPDLTATGIELLGKPEVTARQFFAWTHAMDPHEAYVKHPECPDFGNRERDRYDSELCFTDKWLGRLLDWAREQTWWDDTVVIVTSDHGETFGEHGMAHHAFELWEPLVRVPLLIRVPGVAAKRIDARRSHIDLAPTILELMGQPLGDGFAGRSLVPELFGERSPEPREPIILDLPEDTNESSRRAIIDGNYKLIAFGSERFSLYDIATDPQESTDLAAREPRALEQMKRKLAAVEAQTPYVQPYGGMKLASGRLANGPMRPSSVHFK